MRSMERNVPTIDLSRCTKCGSCVDECPSHTLASKEDRIPFVQSPANCIACGHCVAVCPVDAVTVESLPQEAFTRLSAVAPAEVVRNLLLARRSTRKYLDRPVPRELLEQLIDSGARAGTASNAQTEGFVIIQDKAILTDLANLVIESLWNSLKHLGNPAGRLAVRAAYGDEMSKTLMGYYSAFARTRRNGEDFSIFRDAPVVIVAHGLRKNPLASTNCALAIRNMETFGPALGLATCWAGFLVTAARGRKIARFLGLTDDRNLYGAIMVGYPKHHYGKSIPPRKRDIKWM